MPTTARVTIFFNVPIPINSQFSSLKSHTGNILNVGQPLLISVPNLAQIKKWIKSGPNFGPQPTDSLNGEKGKN